MERKKAVAYFGYGLLYCPTKAAGDAVHLSGGLERGGSSYRFTPLALRYMRAVETWSMGIGGCRCACVL